MEFSVRPCHARFTEAEALRTFGNPERVEGSAVLAEREGRFGWSFSSGLVMRDGAMVQPH